MIPYTVRLVCGYLAVDGAKHSMPYPIDFPTYESQFDAQQILSAISVTIIGLATGGMFAVGSEVLMHATSYGNTQLPLTRWIISAETIKGSGIQRI